jgi:hypothetical protein
LRELLVRAERKLWVEDALDDSKSGSMALVAEGV